MENDGKRRPGGDTIPVITRATARPILKPTMQSATKAAATPTATKAGYLVRPTHPDWLKLLELKQQEYLRRRYDPRYRKDALSKLYLVSKILSEGEVKYEDAWNELLVLYPGEITRDDFKNAVAVIFRYCYRGGQGVEKIHSTDPISHSRL